MLSLHFANRFETLADQLVRRLGEQVPGRSPFEADEVIVPSAAITRRLIIELTQRQGVCANVEFSYLAGWLWKQTAHPAQAARGRRSSTPTCSPGASWARSRTRRGAERSRGCRPGWPTPTPSCATSWRGAWPGCSNSTSSIAPSGWRRGFAASAFACPARTKAPRSTSNGRPRCGAGSPMKRPATAPSDPAALYSTCSTRKASACPAWTSCPPAPTCSVPPTMPPVHLRTAASAWAGAELHLYMLNPSQEFWFDVVDARRLAPAWPRAAGVAYHGGRQPPASGLGPADEVGAEPAGGHGRRRHGRGRRLHARRLGQRARRAAETPCSR